MARTHLRLALLPLALLLLALLSVPCSPPSAAEEPGWTPIEPALPRQAEGYDLLLVLDARTGRPVAGARVESRWEAQHEGGAWAPLAAQGVTDIHGLYRAPAEPEPFPRHWEVRAPGYEPAHEYSSHVFDDTVELLPAVPKHGRIVDVAGRPLAGVTVRWKRGCAHAPTHGSGVTDASGRFVLPDGPDHGDIGVYAGPGVLFDPYGVDVAPTCAEPPVTVAWPGIEVVGHVAPPHGRFQLTLRSTQESQGPLHLLAASGDFAMLNLDWDAHLEMWDYLSSDAPPDAHRPSDVDAPSVDLQAFTPGAKVRFAATGLPIEPAGASVRVRFEGVAQGDEDPVTVHLDRTDGRRFTFPVDPTDGAEAPQLRVPAGAYLVRVDAPFARYEAADVALTAADGAATEAVLQLRVCPEIRLTEHLASIAEALGVSLAGLEHMALYTAAREPWSGSWRVEARLLHDEEGDRPLRITSGAETTLWAHGPLGQVRFELQAAHEGRRAVTWTATPGGALHLVGGDLDAGLVSVRGGALYRVEEQDDGLLLRVERAGSHIVQLDGAEHLVEFPPFKAGKPPARRDATALLPRERPDRTLLLRQGAGWDTALPLASVETHVSTLLIDGPDAQRRWIHGGYDLPDDAVSERGLLLSGLAVAPNTHLIASLTWPDAEEGAGFDLAPQALELVGEGPWTHEIPARGIDLVVRLAAPERLAVGTKSSYDVLLLVAGKLYSPSPRPDGSWHVRVRGLAAGGLPVAVVAKGHQGRQRVLPASATGVTRLDLDLPAR